MNSDNYEFSKSSQPQSVDAYSSYTDKQWNYINDINNGVYANNSGLTQVQFDLTSIYNSGGFTDAGDMYLTIPIVMTAAFATSAGAAVTLPAASVGLGGAAASVGGCAGYSIMALKSNFQNLIHQIEIQADGKVINDTQPFINVMQGFRLLSEMSITDLNTFGPSLNYNQVLDNEKSMQFNQVTPPYSAGTATGAVNVAGAGLLNNVPYYGSSMGMNSQSMGSPVMNQGCVNAAIANRISRYADLTSLPAASAQSLWGASSGTQLTFMTATQLQTEFKPYVAYIGNVITYYDVALIPLKYLTDVMDKLGLVRKLSAVMRIYFNTGSCAAKITNAGTTTQYISPVSSSSVFQSTFANTCPFTFNNVAGATSSAPTANLNPASCPTTAGYVIGGLFISRAPTTSISVGGGSGINIGLNVPNHPMPSCRAYYSLVKMEPSKALRYVEENRSKLVVYEQIITNQYDGITSGSSFSQLVQSGIKNPLAVAIIPLISPSQATGSGSNTYGFAQWGSPLDTCPNTFAPISLTNLQVTLGGQNVLNGASLFYTYENFLEQIILADNLTSSDLGIGAGLISQSFWESNRVYYVDLKRCRDADKAATRNLNISFTNNSNMTISILVFTIYLDKLIVDVETGLIKR